MILYFAGAESSLEKLAEHGHTKILIAMSNGMKKIRKIDTIFPPGYNLMADSGAFTYFSNPKKAIPVDKWIEEAKSITGIYTELISLDVIGDPVKSWENYQEIIPHIPHVIPTLHFGEDVSWLKKYLDYTDRICLGGLTQQHGNELHKHFKKIFSMFDPKNPPKFHALGCSHQELLEQYPFYSCDSTTWQNCARYGEVHSFHKLDFKMNRSLTVSKLNPQGMSIDQLHCYMTGDADLRLRLCVESAKKLEAYLTELWERRGIKWK